MSQRQPRQVKKERTAEEVDTDLWQTPPDVLADFQLGFNCGLPFEYDPAGAHRSYASVQCGTYSTKDGTWLWLPERDDALKLSDTDGLATPWRGRVFVNPPYSNIEPWVRMGALSGLLGAWVVMLLPPSVDTGWFHDYIYDQEKELWRPEVARVQFRKGRIKFNHPHPEKVGKKQPTAGNMIVCFGRAPFNTPLA